MDSRTSRIFSFAIVWVGVAADAWRVARKLGTGYEPKRYNRWPVYALLKDRLLASAQALQTQAQNLMTHCSR